MSKYLILFILIFLVNTIFMVFSVINLDVFWLKIHLIIHGIYFIVLHILLLLALCLDINEFYKKEQQQKEQKDFLKNNNNIVVIAIGESKEFGVPQALH